MKVLKWILVPSILLLAGCAGTMKAIEYTEPRISTKMSKAIFLDPEKLVKNKDVYVRVINTSGFEDINFSDLLKQKLREKGFSIVGDPAKANYIVQVNVLYLDEERESLTEDGMLVGSTAGALAGSYIGGTTRDNLAFALGGAVIGSVIGGLVGKTIAVDRFTGVADVYIKEFNIEHQTRISVRAEKTNMNKPQVLRILAERMADQIANLFVY